VPVTVLRYSTVFGPGELSHRAIPNFLDSLAHGRALQINGDGSEIRDYVYIDDIIQATLLALVKRPNAVLNIGSGQGYTTLHLAKEIIKLYGVDSKLQFNRTARKNFNYTCDIFAARDLLSYNPRTSFENGLAQEIKWYKNQLNSPLLPNKKENLNVPQGHIKMSSLLKYSFWKEIADRLMAIPIIIALSPFLALISIMIAIDSHGTPIFAQERVGKNGRRFVAYKFRTMPVEHDDRKYKEYIRQYVNEDSPYRVDENGNGIYKVDDAKTTRFGSILRKTNLDELPQIYNVLKGDMSLIGPRPDIPYAVDLYKDWHRKRLDAKPGIIGLWQVSNRKNQSFEGMVRLDIDYIKKQSPLLDAKILLLAVSTIMRGDGS
jgi:lipopolysaccharide/colanic/teichoic acid biosynthesis glycosyltransferase